MKVVQQGRRKTMGGLTVVVGALLLLTASAQASSAGGAGAGLAITVQNALTSTLVGVSARLWDVDIPGKAVCRSPFKPPDPVTPKPSWGPPPWAKGKALGLQKDPPWAKAKVKVVKAKG